MTNFLRVLRSLPPGWKHEACLAGLCDLCEALQQDSIGSSTETEPRKATNKQPASAEVAALDKKAARLQPGQEVKLCRHSR